MSNRWYPKAKEALLGGEIDVLTADIVVVLVGSGYVYDDAQEFLSSVDAGHRIATSAALASKTVTNGIFKAADPLNIPAVPTGTVTAILVVLSTGDDATSRLLVHVDGIEQIEVAADAALSATEVTFEDVPTAIGSGATLTKVSGTGPATIETAATASAGDRALTVVALSDAVTAGAVYSYQSGLFPLATTGGQVTIDWDDTYGIAAL